MRAVRSFLIAALLIGLPAAPALAQSPACQVPAEIERALATQPSAEAYNALGAWFAQRNRMACAIPAFQSAIRLRPGAWDGHFNLALALMNDREFKQAISELRQADKLSPGRAPVHTALGIALQESGQLPGEHEQARPAHSRRRNRSLRWLPRGHDHRRHAKQEGGVRRGVLHG